MDTTTLLIIVLVILLVGGGGWYGPGAAGIKQLYQTEVESWRSC